MGDVKVKIKNNRFKMRNKQVSQKVKGGAMGAILGIVLKVGLGYLGVDLPEELSGEIGMALATLVGSLFGGYFAPADDPETIEEAA